MFFEFSLSFNDISSVAKTLPVWLLKDSLEVNALRNDASDEQQQHEIMHVALLLG